MNLLEKAWYLLTQWREVRAAIGVTRFGGLAHYGWLRSMREQASVDARGEPLPWISYPAIELLAQRVPADAVVFEYGCGNGTPWWAARVARIEACESDEAWQRRISTQLPASAKVTLIPEDRNGRYCRAAQEARGPFDIIVVDGRDRVNCVEQSVACLSPRGVLVLDNSDRAEYGAAFTFMAARGFRNLDLIGLAPSIDYRTSTTIFYRNGNCLRL